ncbi:hypothetical protein MBLNU459_g8370t1 [Dothideomycetes sp. NU459]
MAPALLHHAGHNSQQPDDPGDEDYFVKKYYEISRKGRERRDKAHERLRQANLDRTQALKADIEALQTHGPVQKSDGSGPMSKRKEHLEALRDLLIRKNNIEMQIASCAEALEQALKTTSGEVQVCLESRAESSNGAAASIAQR